MHRAAVVVVMAVIATVTGFVTPSAAQPVDQQQISRFLGSPSYKSVLNRALAQIRPDIFVRCANLRSTGARVFFYKPITFAADGAPNAGAWKQLIPVAGCGNDTVLNIIFVVHPDEKINFLILLPGTTHADPTLQRDALVEVMPGPTMYAATHGKKEDCKQFDITNTRFGGYGNTLVNPAISDPGPNDHYRPWWETWTLSGCGRAYDVSVAFTPTKDRPGTNITVPGNRVVELSR